MARVKMMVKLNDEKIVFGVEYKGIAGHYLIDVWGNQIPFTELRQIKPIEKIRYQNNAPKVV